MSSLTKRAMKIGRPIRCVQTFPDSLCSRKVLIAHSLQVCTPRYPQTICGLVAHAGASETCSPPARKENAQDNKISSSLAGGKWPSLARGILSPLPSLTGAILEALLLPAVHRLLGMPVLLGSPVTRAIFAV